MRGDCQSRRIAAGDSCRPRQIRERASWDPSRPITPSRRSKSAAVWP